MQENVKNDRFQRNAGIFVRQMFVIMNIILSMFIFSSVTTAAVNPDVQYNGHSYKIFNDGMTWQQAKKYCEGLGGHLVTITSVQEQDIVVGLLRNKGTKNSYWMGGYKNGSYWVWITEEPFQYSKWATWQPDGDGSALMMYRNKNPYAREGLGYWNDVSFTGECKNEPFFGSVNFGFVCEWDSTPNTSIPINGEYGSGSKKTVTLPDGWYTIQPLHDLGRSIDALGSQVNSGNNVHMWDSVDSALQQKFYLQNRGNNYFSLRSAYGAKLYVTADGLGNGANLYTSSWNNSDSQLFRLVDAGKNSYHIFAKIGSNLNFDCAGGGKTNGNNVQLWTSENNNWHKWRFTKTSPPSNVTLSDGWYRIQPMHDLSRSVDALGNATHNGNNVHMWTNVDAAQQKFYLQNRGNGYFSLMSAYGSQLYITADGNSHGANLYTSDWTGSDAQLFKLSDAGDNSYNVFAKINENLNFDCYGGYTRDGNNVQLWNSENNKWHQWRFTKVFNNPQGEVQVVESTSPNTLHVRGTAFDLDNPSGSIRLHVYVGGTPGSSVPQYEILTDGNSRIFEDTREIDSNYSGRQTVHIYALNDYGEGDTIEIWNGEVEIQSDIFYPIEGNYRLTTLFYYEGIVKSLGHRHSVWWHTSVKEGGHFNALDIACSEGTPVKAVASGKVINELSNSSSNVIVIEHDNSMIGKSLYAHLSEKFVEPGDVVSEGQIIGKSGNAGVGPGNYHLHLEWFNSSPWEYYRDKVRFQYEKSTERAYKKWCLPEDKGRFSDAINWIKNYGGGFR